MGSGVVVAASDNLGGFSGPSSTLSELDLGTVLTGEGGGGRHWGHSLCEGVCFSQKVTGDSNLGGLMKGIAMRTDMGIPGLGAC